MRLRQWVGGLVGLGMVVCAGSASTAERGEKSPDEGKAAVEIATVVTAATMVYDYEAARAVFEKDVFVDDPRLRLWADRLVLEFDGTNQIRTLVAEGAVRFAQAEARGSCRKAEYRAANGLMVLSGEAVLLRGSDEMQADSIAFVFMNNEIRHVRAEGNVRMRRASDGASELPALLPRLMRETSP